MYEDIPNHVTFVTALFNTTEVKDYFINDCCFGDDCAQWLIDKLKAQNGVQVDEEPGQEDWGWYFCAAVGPRRFLVGVGLCEDEDAPNTWLVFVESELGWLKRKLLGQTDHAELLLVCEAFDHVLKSEPLISDVRWHEAADWMKAREDN
jgi:hypothetical protein